MDALTDPAIEKEEQAIRIFRDALDICSPELRRDVRYLVERHRKALIVTLYDDLTRQREQRFLPHPDRRATVMALFEDWLVDLFSVDDDADIAATVARQRQIGQVHARIQLPTRLLIHSMQTLRRSILGHLADTPLERHDLLWAAEYVNSIMDASRALIVTTFVDDTERKARIDESYRLYVLGQNLNVERERQRAALVEWSHEVLLSLYRAPPRLLPTLAQSEFGLWFRHKGVVMFESAPEVGLIQAAIARIDEHLLPVLASQTAEASTIEPQSPMQTLENETGSIRYYLNLLFEHHIEVENGRDTLTRLLTRRFIPVVLGRELAIARQPPGRGFAVGLLDLDRFKQINDLHGHDVGDQVLQQVATTIMNTLRSGDFVFRYGGEEFLLCLAEVERHDAYRILDLIREKIEESPVRLADGQAIEVTVSVGMALYDGHPDYQTLISRADEALYRAKNQGRNRVVEA